MFVRAEDDRQHKQHDDSRDPDHQSASCSHAAVRGVVVDSVAIGVGVQSCRSICASRENERLRIDSGLLASGQSTAAADHSVAVGHRPNRVLGKQWLWSRQVLPAVRAVALDRQEKPGLVEAAGIEPASASPPLRGLHAYPAIVLTPDYPTGREDPEPVQ